MSTLFRTVAADQGTYVVTAAFTDEDGASVVPNAIAWSLSDGAGAIVNSRDAVSVTPAASITIVLSGGDLDYADGRERVVTIEATYDSSLGNDLPLNDQAQFLIEDLLLVS